MFFQLCLQTQMCFSGTRGPYSVPHQCLHFLHFPFMTVIWQLAVWRTGSKGTAGEKSFETLSGLRTRGSTQEEESNVISNKEKLQMQFAGVMLSDLTCTYYFSVCIFFSLPLDSIPSCFLSLLTYLNHKRAFSVLYIYLFIWQTLISKVTCAFKLYLL